MDRAGSASAVAHSNIALIKYWGKRDEKLILPHQSSLSLTVRPLSVVAKVDFGVESTSVMINGRDATPQERAKVEYVCGLVRGGPVRVTSDGNFPMSAGLASSAAAFAALAVATHGACGVSHDPRMASLLARQGSGSASRSVIGGFSIWHRGTLADGSDSFAEQVVDEHYWPSFRMVAAMVHEGEKEQSSREAMRRTVTTSPLYSAWAQDAERSIRPATDLVLGRDIEQLGDLAERNAWGMHSTAMSADPAICYLLPATLRIIAEVRKARKMGIPVWFTLDAGPNPVLMTLSHHVELVEEIARESGALRTMVCHPGPGARVIWENAH